MIFDIVSKFDIRYSIIFTGSQTFQDLIGQRHILVVGHALWPSATGCFLRGAGSSAIENTIILLLGKRVFPADENFKSSTGFTFSILFSNNPNSPVSIESLAKLRLAQNFFPALFEKNTHIFHVTRHQRFEPPPRFARSLWRQTNFKIFVLLKPAKSSPLWPTVARPVGPQATDNPCRWGSAELCG